MTPGRILIAAGVKPDEADLVLDAIQKLGQASPLSYSYVAEILLAGYRLGLKRRTDATTPSESNEGSTPNVHVRRPDDLPGSPRPDLQCLRSLQPGGEGEPGEDGHGGAPAGVRREAAETGHDDVLTRQALEFLDTQAGMDWLLAQVRMNRNQFGTKLRDAMTRHGRGPGWGTT